MAAFAFAVAAVCAVVATATSAPAQSPAAAAMPRPPNIVFIMADDHGRQAISCYGSQIIQTPNIDRLARQGMRFTEAFANNSICSPSRAVLLTGKYNHLCGVRKLSEHFDGSQQSFPKLLQQSGYRTAIVGKWHLFTEPTGFDYYCLLPGFGLSYDSPFKEIGQPWGNNGNKGGVVHKGYFTDVITDISLNWLEHRDTNKPFCLMIHHRAPHSPHDPAPRHQDLFKNASFPEPPNLLDDYRGRAAEPVANLLSWSRLDQTPRGYFPNDADFRQQLTGERAHDTRLGYQTFLRGYLRLVTALDENVGRVLDYLDQTGLAKNTIVIYTSDNGFFLGEHGFYNKMWMYEEGFHIPLIIRMPGAQGGVSNGRFVSMLDIAPTMLELGGAKVPSDIQGCSLKPLLTGQAMKWREAFYYHYYGAAGAPVTNWIGSHEVLGMRTSTTKLVFYPTWKNGPFWEYFDLAHDPREMHNLYKDPQHHAEVAAAKAKLRELARHYQDTEAVNRLEDN